MMIRIAVRRYPVAIVRTGAAALAGTVLAASILAAGAAHAGTYTWTGNSSTDWSTINNWSPATVPGPADEAAFTGSFTNSPVMSGNPYLGQFHAPGSLANSFTASVGGNALSLMATNNGNIGLLIDASSTPNNFVTLSSGTLLAANFESWINNNANGAGFATPGSGNYSLVISSRIGLGFGITLTLSGSGSTRISGVIAGSPGTVAINNTGVVELSGANTFSGSVSIAQGAVLVSGIANTGTAQPLGVSSTALVLGGSATSGELYLMQSQSGSTNRAVAIGAGGGVLFVDSGASNTFSGLISGSGRLTKDGPGLLTLSRVNNTYAGGTTIAGGVLQLGNTNTLANQDLAVSGGTLDLAGRKQTVKALSGSGVIGNSKVGTSNSATLTVSNGGTFSGTIQNGVGAGSALVFLQLTGGTLTLTGTDTYSGATTVGPGKLVVNGSLTSSFVSIQSGGILGGTGSLTSATVNTGGHLAPGNSAGMLQLSGNLELFAGALMDYELDSPGTSDEVSMPTGLLKLHGQQFSDFSFTPLTGFSGGTFTLVDAGSITGSLGANLSGTINGLSATLSVQGNDLVLTVVPEPGTLVLLAIGAFGLLAYMWRRHRPRLTAGIATIALLSAGSRPWSQSVASRSWLLAFSCYKAFVFERLDSSPLGDYASYYLFHQTRRCPCAIPQDL